MTVLKLLRFFCLLVCIIFNIGSSFARFDSPVWTKYDSLLIQSDILAAFQHADSGVLNSTKCSASWSLSVLNRIEAAQHLGNYKFKTDSFLNEINACPQLLGTDLDKYQLRLAFGNTLLKRGKVFSALEKYNSGLDVVEDPSIAYAEIQLAIGKALLSGEEFEMAQQFLMNASSALTKLGQDRTPTHASLYHLLSQYYYQSGQLQRAQLTLLQSIGINKDLNRNLPLAYDYVLLSQLNLKLKNYTLASKYQRIASGLTISKEINTIIQLQEAETKLKQGSANEALNTLTKIKSDALASGNRLHYLNSISLQNQVYKAKGDFQNAYNIEKEVTRIKDDMGFGNIYKTYLSIKKARDSKLREVQNELNEKDDALLEKDDRFTTYLKYGSAIAVLLLLNCDRSNVDSASDKTCN